MQIENITAAAAGADIQPSPRLRDLDLATVPFGSVFSDHMFRAQFKDGRWSEGLIQPYGPIFLAPSISALHYGISVFEGLKAHKSPTGQLLLFRPRENARRFQKSAVRLAMPAVPESLFLEGVRELVRLDQNWIPQAGAAPCTSGRFCFRPSLRSG
jgi:branched-chain amino acid aminotransferase